MAQGQVELVVSDALVTELAGVLARPHIRARTGYTPADEAAFVNGIVNSASMVRPIEELDIVRDAADNRLIEAALAGGAEYVVSGDRVFLAQGSFRGVRMIAPMHFLSILSASQ